MTNQIKWLLALLTVVIIGAVTSQTLGQKTSNEPQTNQEAKAAEAVSYNCEAGQTAYTLLAATYSVETKDTSFGRQVMAINSIRPNDSQFWAFYIDGQSATVGADSYTCHGNEMIRWRIESF